MPVAPDPVRPVAPVRPANAFFNQFIAQKNVTEESYLFNNDGQRMLTETQHEARHDSSAQQSSNEIKSNSYYVK